MGRRSETRTGIVFADLQKIEIDVGKHSGGGGVFEKVDSLGIAERKDEDERRDDDGEAAVEIELVAKQRIAGVGKEETVPLVAQANEKEYLGLINNYMNSSGFFKHAAPR